MQQTGVISFGSTRREWVSEAQRESQQLANKTQNGTSQTLLSRTQVLALLARSVMNGTALKMEHIVMLTNKGRCQAMGWRQWEMGFGLPWQQVVNKTSAQTTGDGRWQTVTRDRGYMQSEMTQNEAVLKWIMIKAIKRSLIHHSWLGIMVCVIFQVKMSKYLLVRWCTDVFLWFICFLLLLLMMMIRKSLLPLLPTNLPFNLQKAINWLFY